MTSTTHPPAGLCQADEPTTDDPDLCVYEGCPAADTFVCPCGDRLCEDHADRDHFAYCGDYRAWATS
jgi:hypothetical protein